MYKIDFARGFAYRGRKGFIIRVEPRGLYIVDKGKKIYLTDVKKKEDENEAVSS